MGLGARGRRTGAFKRGFCTGVFTGISPVGPCKGDAGSKPILELNMRHPLVAALGTAHSQSRTEDASDLAALLFEEACILDGEVPEDPAAFATRLNRLVVRGLTAS